MIYIGAAVFDKNGAAHQGSGVVDGAGQFVSVKLDEQAPGSLKSRRVSPADLSPEAAPSVDADAPIEATIPKPISSPESAPISAPISAGFGDEITAANARQNAFFRDADLRGTNDRADVTSGDGISRFDKPGSGRVSAPADTETFTPPTSAPVDIEPAVLLARVQNALIEYRDDIVEAEEPVLWSDGRFGALITLRVDDPDGHLLEYPDHPNHSDEYFADDSFEYAMKYRNRGLTKVYVNFD